MTKRDTEAEPQRDNERERERESERATLRETGRTTKIPKGETERETGRHRAPNVPSHSSLSFHNGRLESSSEFGKADQSQVLTSQWQFRVKFRLHNGRFKLWIPNAWQIRGKD